MTWKVVFIFFLFFISCRENAQNSMVGNKDVPQIVFSFSDTILKQSDFFEIVNVIKLEVNDSSLIAEPTNVICRSSGFYLLDNQIGKQVVKFDTAGNFQFVVNKHGRGPGEFLSMYGISVDPLDRFLYLFDAEQSKVICYDAQNGDYIRYIPFHYNAYAFSVLPDGSHFIFYNSFKRDKELKTEEGCPNFIIIDSLGRIEKTFAYYDARIESPNIVCVRDVFAACGAEFYCFSRYNDEIYSIDEKQNVSSAYMLNFMNDNQIKNEYLLKKIAEYDGIDFDRSEEDHKKAEAYELTNLCFTGRYIYIAGIRTHTNGMFNYLYDKVLSKTINLSALVKDVVGQNLYFMAADHQYFYVPVPVNYLKEAIHEEPKLFSSELVTILRNMDENDNPVIIKLKIKDVD